MSRSLVSLLTTILVVLFLAPAASADNQEWANELLAEVVDEKADGSVQAVTVEGLDELGPVGELAQDWLNGRTRTYRSDAYDDDAESAPPLNADGLEWGGNLRLGPPSANGRRYVVRLSLHF